jgi:hypothetical protein
MARRVGCWGSGRAFAVRRCVFLTDVAGVYDRPPNQPVTLFFRPESFAKWGVNSVEKQRGLRRGELEGNVLLPWRLLFECTVGSTVVGGVGN